MSGGDAENPRRPFSTRDPRPRTTTTSVAGTTFRIGISPKRERASATGLCIGNPNEAVGAEATSASHTSPTSRPTRTTRHSHTPSSPTSSPSTRSYRFAGRRDTTRRG